jgi:hypothetical protein
MGKLIRFGLHDAYYDPRTGFGGINTFFKRQKEEHNYNYRQVKDFLGHQEARQINAQPPDVYFPIWGRGESSFQADLMFMDTFRGWIGMLCIINVNTRVAYTYPIKSKTASEIAPHFETWASELKKKKLPMEYIQTDGGKEFNNSQVLAIWSREGIDHNFTVRGDHAGQGKVERFNQTIRGLMTKYLDAYKTNDWVSVVDDLTFNYNNRIHRILGVPPAEASETETLSQQMAQYNLAMEQQNKFDIGDRVRTLDEKNVFTKGRKHWSDEVYTIDEAAGHRFHLEGKGWFKYSELLKIVGDVQTSDIVPKERIRPEPEISKAEKKQTRALAKEGIDKAEPTDKVSRVAKQPDRFVAEPSKVLGLWSQPIAKKTLLATDADVAAAAVRIVVSVENRKTYYGLNRGPILSGDDKGKYLIDFDNGSQAAYTAEEVHKFRLKRGVRVPERVKKFLEI